MSVTVLVFGNMFAGDSEELMGPAEIPAACPSEFISPHIS
jgi:hypothetical protein